MASTHTATIVLVDGREVYQSYGVTVAAFIPGRGHLRTSARYSVTTSRHMNQFVGKNTTEVSHAELLKLTEPVASRL